MQAEQIPCLIQYEAMKTSSSAATARSRSLACYVTSRDCRSLMERPMLSSV